jgi:hypothetical protein
VSDLAELFEGRRVGRVLERRDTAAAVVIAHDPEKQVDSACTRIGDELQAFVDLERLVTDIEQEPDALGARANDVIGHSGTVCQPLRGALPAALLAALRA